MLRRATIFVAAAMLALGIGSGSLGATNHALADSNAQGTGQYPGLVAYCQSVAGQGPYAESVGACVSAATSGGNSNAYAPGLCSWIASTYLGNGYGFYLQFYNPTSDNYESAGPVKNKGQCVSAIGQYSNMGYYAVDASYTPFP